MATPELFKLFALTLIIGFAGCGLSIKPASSSQVRKVPDKEASSQVATTPSASRDASPPLVLPKLNPFKSAKRKPAKNGFVESAAEKEYERRKGVEVVHRKDGTTYERKAPKKRKK